MSSRTLRIDFHIIFFDNGLHKTDYELQKNERKKIRFDSQIYGEGLSEIKQRFSETNLDFSQIKPYFQKVNQIKKKTKRAFERANSQVERSLFFSLYTIYRMCVLFHDYFL